jgi:translocator protein
MGKIKVFTLIICFLIVILVAFLGSLFTGPNTSTDWYQQIKPAITPPNFVFPIAWTILFILVGISLYLVWTNSKDKEDRKKVAWVFGINLFLNVLWSLFFFGLRNPLLGFIEIILFWFTIWMMIFVARKINKASMWLLVPYLLWVSFAAILNGLSAFA